MAVAISVLVILGGVLLYRFVFIKPPVKKQETGQLKGLTQEEKQKIIGQLATTTPLTAQEKTKILKQLSTTTKPLSDEEKAKILDSLKNTN